MQIAAVVEHQRHAIRQQQARADTGSPVAREADDQQVLDSMRILLRNWGYQVLAACSLEQTLALLDGDAHRPDLVVGDFRLAADVIGIDVIRAVLNTLHTVVPTILVTGDTSPQGIGLASASGYQVLHKPPDPQRLRATISQLLAASPRG